MRHQSAEKEIDISEVGLIIESLGEYDEEGNEITAPVFKDGHYVIAVEPIADWAQWLSNDDPHIVFAGCDTTTVYKFADRAEFKSVFNDSDPQPVDVEDLPRGPDS